MKYKTFTETSDDILNQNELFSVIEEKALQKSSSGQRKDLQGRTFEE